MLFVALHLLATAATAATGATCPYTAGAATVAVAGQPFAVQATSDGCWLFASLTNAGGGGGIAVLHNQGGRFVLTGTVRLRAGTTGLALTHDGRMLLATSGDDVVAFDAGKLETGAGGAEIGRVAEGPGAAPVFAAISNDDRLAFISDERAARITVLDLGRARAAGFNKTVIVGRIPQGQAPVGLALSPDGTRLYATSERVNGTAAFPTRCGAEHGDAAVSHGEGALAIIDVAKAATDPAKAVVMFLPAGCNPVRVALTADGRTAWVSARGENAAYAIPVDNEASPRGHTRSRYDTGDSPVGIAVQPQSGEVWVSNSNRFGSGAGSVQTVPTGGAPGRLVPSGRFPRNLLILPDGQTLVVAVFGSKALQFVPTAVTAR